MPSNSTNEQIYYWKLSDFTLCSKTCGGGIQERHPICYKRYEGIVEDKLCWTNAENKRPEKITRACNDEKCPAYWWIGPWQPCPVTCQNIGKFDSVAYLGPGIPVYPGPDTPAYLGPGIPAYLAPGIPAYLGPGIPAYLGPGIPAYLGPGIPAYLGR